MGEWNDRLRNGLGVKIVSITLGTLLAAAAVGTWRMANEFSALKTQVESQSKRMDRQADAIDRIRDRVRYIERQDNGRD